VKKLIASDSATHTQFGYSVGISGDLAIVGAYRGDSRKGAAYIYHRNLGGPDNWGEAQKLTASDGKEFDFLGSSVSINGDRLVVGAEGKNAAYIFAAFRPPMISKTFGPATIPAGGTSTITLTLSNPNNQALTNASFTDTLVNMSAVGGAVGGTCSGTTSNTLSTGATSLSFSGVTIPASSSCTVTFAVTSNMPGTKSNQTSGVASNETGAAGSPSNVATLTVNKANSTTAITSDNPDPSVTGQAVTVAYTVTPNSPGAGTPTGNVTVNATTGESCTGTVAAGSCTITFNTLGARNLMATYAGDSNFNGSASAAAAHQVNCQTITVTAPAIALGTLGQPFNQTFTQAGGFGATTFSTTSTLPTGLTLAANGTLSGTPTQAGSFPITVKATDSNGCTGQVNYTLQVTTFGGSISDPLACTGPGNDVTGTIQLNNPAAVAQAFMLTTTLTNFAGVPGSCTLTGAAAGATCTVTAGGLAANGSILANTTLTVQYQAQVADVPSGTTATASNVATLGGAPVAPNPLVFTTTINCPAVGPGLRFPATSEVSDQKAGSVLIYNIYTSSATSGNTQNTRINITNVHPLLPAFVHLFFVSESCSVADSYICLTGNQTSSFLASDLDPGTTGYIVAVAVDGIRGCPTSFNYLIGDEYVKFTTGHAASLGAEAISALAGGLPLCDGNSVTSTLNFDGFSYDMVSHVLADDSVGSRADGNDTLLILNRIGGNLATGAGSLSSVFGIFYDDAETAVSFSFNGGHQFRSSLSNNFPRITPRFETFIPAGRTGWFKLWPTTPTLWGMTGAAINFNPNAASSSGAFNQGHNLHKLRLTNTASYVIPIFPPGC
nr:putative Ig domain-containing protein [Acidobacteriota bacterium]